MNLGQIELTFFPILKQSTQCRPKHHIQRFWLVARGNLCCHGRTQSSCKSAADPRKPGNASSTPAAVQSVTDGTGRECAQAAMSAMLQQ